MNTKYEKLDPHTDDQVDIMDKKRLTKLELIYVYALMLWDGLSFFGFDDTKLERLRDKKKLKMTDKCTSKRWVLVSIISTAVIVYILVT